MPLQGVPPHVLNLRRILLSRVGASVNAEDDAINSLKTQISGRVPDLLSPSEGGTTLTTLFHDTTQLSVTIRSAIASWVRQSVAACFRPSHTEAELNPGVVTRQETVTCRSTTNSMSLCQFREVRKILEELRDFSILADVLHIVSNSADCSVLAAVCESISYHFGIFAAMGAHASLFNDLYQRYEDLRHSKIIDVFLLESLIDLGRCISNAGKEVKRIEQQALLYHQNSTVIACSPISESMAEAVHSAESHSAEDIEQVLASGTSMDKQTLAQLFEAIIKRMEASWTDSTSNMASYAELLIRLRGFGRKDYDSLIHGWVGHVLRNPARPALGEIFVPLICSACLMLKKLLELAVSVLDESSQHDPRAVLSVEMLEMLATMSADEALTTHQVRVHRPVRLLFAKPVARADTVFVCNMVRLSEDVQALRFPSSKQPSKHARTQEAKCILGHVPYHDVRNFESS
jgi:mediator of RNA polymerase II transcription subunit 12